MKKERDWRQEPFCPQRRPSAMLAAARLSGRNTAETNLEGNPAAIMTSWFSLAKSLNMSELFVFFPLCVLM